MLLCQLQQGIQGFNNFDFVKLRKARNVIKLSKLLARIWCFSTQHLLLRLNTLEWVKQGLRLCSMGFSSYFTIRCFVRVRKSKQPLNYSLRRSFSFLDRPPVERPSKQLQSYMQQGLPFLDGCLISSRYIKVKPRVLYSYVKNFLFYSTASKRPSKPHSNIVIPRFTPYLVNTCLVKLRKTNIRFTFFKAVRKTNIY